MIYPVNNFKQDWYIATGFGIQRPGDNYFHEAADINLNTGGDTDLGQELKAIANGRIVYYHNFSHSNTIPSFGRHLVIKIDGAWGTRWVHYAHMSDQDFHGAVQDVTEGQLIGRVGKSGTTVAHVHFAVFKKDPATVGGIDNIANTLVECNDIWEDPIKFIETWMQTQQPTPSPVTDQSKYDFGDGFGSIELQQARSIMQDQKNLINGQNSKISQIKAIVG